MAVLIASAGCLLAALCVLGVHRLRRETTRRLDGLGAALAELGAVLRDTDPTEREEPHVSAEMQEGFDNLMRYSVKTARGKDGGPC